MTQKMGRTNGKLIPFLQKYLQMEKFLNLGYEEDKKIFFIVLPRYVPKKACEEYEAVLKEWYICNGRLEKYKDYSNAKSVLQAALKKSIYLMKEKKVGQKLRFRFANKEEMKENYRLLKEKERAKYRNKEACHLSNEEPQSPTSSTSSGYNSGTEDFEVPNMWADEMQIPDGFFEDMLQNPEKYLNDYDISDEDFFCDINAENPPLLSLPSHDMAPVEEFGLIPPVTELKTIPVNQIIAHKKYWLCTQKMKVKSTLQLICESQIIESENSGVNEGAVIIPNNVFEPGITYDLKKSFELDGVYHLFFTPNSI